jgi:hypothetical protein
MKVEGKSRYANCLHVNAAHRGTQVFHTRRPFEKGFAICFQLRSDYDNYEQSEPQP